MVAQAKHLSEFAIAVEAIVEANKAALGLTDVFYGDQALIPRTPCAAIEPGSKDVGEPNMTRRVEANMTTYIIIYHSTFGSPQDNRKDADALAEQLEDILNNASQMNGLVIHSYVARAESGYATKGNSIMRSSRLTFVGLVKYQLSS